MTLTVDQIKQAALELSPDVRERLADELYLSVANATHEEIDAAWVKEIKRREEQTDRGEVQWLDGDEVIQKLRAKYSK